MGDSKVEADGLCGIVCDAGFVGGLADAVQSGRQCDPVSKASFNMVTHRNMGGVRAHSNKPRE